MTATHGGRGAKVAKAALIPAAEDLAGCFRDRYGLVGARFDIGRWCDRLRVVLAVKDQLEEGRYVRGQNGPTITLRRGGSNSRATFTAAHELGHHMVDQARRDPVLRASLRPSTVRTLGRMRLGSGEEEPFCDVLAGALLIERADVDSVVKQGRLDLATLLLTAQERRMSVIASFVRIQQICGTPDVLASCQWQDGGWVVRSCSASPLPLPATVRPLQPSAAMGRDEGFLWCGRSTKAVTGQAHRQGATLWLLLNGSAAWSFNR